MYENTFFFVTVKYFCFITQLVSNRYVLKTASDTPGLIDICILVMRKYHKIGSINYSSILVYVMVSDPGVI